MSIKKWQEIAKQKQEVENQRQSILIAIKERKVQEEMGELAESQEEFQFQF